MEVLLSCENAVSEGAVRELLARDGGARNIVSSTRQQIADDVARLQPDVVILEVPDGQLNGFYDLVREVHQLSTGRVIAIGSTSDAKSILTILRCGAGQYIGRDELDLELGQVLRRVDDTHTRRKQRARTIALVGAGGGCGTSTLAANMAVAFAGGKNESGLIDLKLESGDLAALLNLKAQHTLVDFCQNMNRMDRGMFENCFMRHSTGVRLLASPSSLEELPWVSASGVRRAVCLARSMFPYVIIDVGIPFRDEHAQALYQSEIVMLVMRLDFSSLRQAHRVLEFIRSKGIDKSRLRLVINRVTRSRDLRVRDVEQALGLRASQVFGEDSKLVNRANNRGVPVMQWAPNSKISRQLAVLAHSVNGVLRAED